LLAPHMTATPRPRSRKPVRVTAEGKFHHRPVLEGSLQSGFAFVKLSSESLSALQGFLLDARPGQPRRATKMKGLR
jgi:hypothetical protein